MPLVVDVTDSAAFREFVDAEQAFGSFVNNAGTNRPRSFAEVTEDDFDTVIGLNVRAAYFAAQAVARKLIAEGRPCSIINMSSQMGHVGGAGRSVYCASKFALEGMTKAEAIDLAPHRIRMNTVCPTFIETPMTAPFLADGRPISVGSCQDPKIGCDPARPTKNP